MKSARINVYGSTPKKYVRTLLTNQLLLFLDFFSNLREKIFLFFVSNEKRIHFSIATTKMYRFS